ncbi:iron uptake porin [Aphanothece sacrum]|uniref:Carbohydrate-selective porin OprB n=1 Tax=Aphanothece sacrum FPU1 TaxID=1920663 RepID=A0A401IE88_APHSA|nr:iron uptake porin [Aphanothece sacrum]GBF79602.1 carbohydrate-selective porin OprB [Aphanothece sacrum FPU1]
MSRLFQEFLKKTPIALGFSLLVAQSAIASPNPEIQDSQEQLVSSEVASPEEALGVVRSRPELKTPLNRTETKKFDNSVAGEPMSQVTSISELRDVSPTDWAYEALRSLVERYGCIVGYPDRTFRGNRATSRWEFAAGLNACLNTIERLLQENVAVLREDIEKLKRLAQEFEAELTALGARVSNLEERVAFLEDHQFSTTTKLRGEVLFSVSGASGERALDFREQNLFNQGRLPNGRRRIDDNANLGYRVRLNINTSFTGKDFLTTRLQAGSVFDYSDPTGTQMARLSYDTTSNLRNTSNVIVDNLWYRFPIGNFTGYVGGTGLDVDDIFDVGNPFLNASGTGTLSRFLRYDPLTARGNEGIGGGFAYKFADWVTVRGLYLAPSNTGNDPALGRGLFNGNFSAGGQLGIYPTQSLAFNFTFMHHYFTADYVNPNPNNPNPNRLNTTFGTGSYVEPNNRTAAGVNSRRLGVGIGRDPFLGAPTIMDAYGLNGNWRINQTFNLTGWVGYGLARAQGLDANGQSRRGFGADIWTWMAALNIVDLGKEGAVLSFAGGSTTNSRRIDALPGDLTVPDQDTPYIFETQYQYPLTKNILLTPGVYVIINPDGNNSNNSIWVGALRTTFRF